MSLTTSKKNRFRLFFPSLHRKKIYAILCVSSHTQTFLYFQVPTRFRGHFEADLMNSNRRICFYERTLPM